MCAFVENGSIEISRHVLASILCAVHVCRSGSSSGSSGTRSSRAGIVKVVYIQPMVAYSTTTT